MNDVRKNNCSYLFYNSHKINYKQKIKILLARLKLCFPKGFLSDNCLYQGKVYVYDGQTETKVMLM